MRDALEDIVPQSPEVVTSATAAFSSPLTKHSVQSLSRQLTKEEAESVKSPSGLKQVAKTRDGRPVLLAPPPPLLELRTKDNPKKFIAAMLVNKQFAALASYLPPSPVPPVVACSYDAHPSSSCDAAPCVHNQFASLAKQMLQNVASFVQSFAGLSRQRPHVLVRQSGPELSSPLGSPKLSPSHRSLSSTYARSRSQTCLVIKLNEPQPCLSSDLLCEGASCGMPLFCSDRLHYRPAFASDPGRGRCDYSPTVFGRCYDTSFCQSPVRQMIRSQRH